VVHFYLTSAKVQAKVKSKLSTFSIADRIGMSFLVSFLNVALRLASSSKNFMVFGGNVDETSGVVHRFFKYFLHEIEYLETNISTIVAKKDETKKDEFKLQELPNDMKMLAFLGGERFNAAMYFSTFVDITQNNTNDIDKRFGN